MSHLDTYRDSFPNARLTRSKTGVLEVALHTNGGTLAFKSHRAAGKGVSQPSSFPARQDAVPPMARLPGRRFKTGMGRLHPDSKTHQHG